MKREEAVSHSNHRENQLTSRKPDHREERVKREEAVSHSNHRENQLTSRKPDHHSKPDHPIHQITQFTNSKRKTFDTGKNGSYNNKKPKRRNPNRRL